MNQTIIYIFYLRNKHDNVYEHTKFTHYNILSLILNTLDCKVHSHKHLFITYKYVYEDYSNLRFLTKDPSRSEIAGKLLVWSFAPVFKLDSGMFN